MSFRRYGGSFEGRGSDGGNLNTALIGLACLILGAILFLFTGDVEFIGLGFILLFIFSVISIVVPGGGTFDIKKKRQGFHIEQAMDHYKAQNYISALASFEQAISIKELPEEFVFVYECVKNKCRGA